MEVEKWTLSAQAMRQLNSLQRFLLDICFEHTKLNYMLPKVWTAIYLEPCFSP